eukprot:jgi/Botrbrau1/5382/Bobra.0346s0043.1
MSPRLLPFVLAALADSQPLVQEAAAEVLWESWRIDALYYLPQEGHGLGWQSNDIISRLYGPTPEGPTQGSGIIHGLRGRGPVQRVRTRSNRLPPSRPALGERRLIQANFGRVVDAIANELLSWQADHSVKAAALLFHCLRYLEDHVTAHLHKLLPVLCKVLESNSVAAGGIRRCCQLMGIFVPPASYAPVLMPEIIDMTTGQAFRRGRVSVLLGLLAGAGERMEGNAPIVGKIKRAVRDLIDFEVTELSDLASSYGSSLTSAIQSRKALQELLEQLV